MKAHLALQLSSDQFLNNFTDEFLTMLDIQPYSRTNGTKDRLNLTLDAVLSALFVDGELSYSKENLLSWVRTLKPYGLLCLEAVPYKTAADIADLFPGFLTLVNTPNPAIWVFCKERWDPAAMHRQCVQAMQDNVPTDELFEQVAKYQWADPSAVLECFMREKYFMRAGMPTLAAEQWQMLMDRACTPKMQIYAALGTLSTGDYYRGFQKRERVMANLHERRSKTPPTADIYDKRWKGEPPAGKTMLIWTEFGLGDELMFAQLAYYFKRRGAAKVVLIAQSPIVGVLQTHPDIDVVVDYKQIAQTLPEFDYWVYPHEILAYEPTPFKHLPKRHPYLTADPQKYAAAQSLIADNGKLNIGIVWRGDPTHENDSHRSIHHLAHIESLFQLKNVNWYCVQKACNEAELALLQHHNVPHPAKQFNDFTDTAAFLMHMDCLVTVDTSVAHIAGGLGVPTLLMLPYICDWRWGSIGSDNLWYPNIQSYRCQSILPDYSSVIDAVKQALTQRQQQKNKPA